MEIQCTNDLTCLEAIRDAVVVLDVFRASNTIIALVAGGARVCLVAGVDQARALKAAHPGWPLLGERQGVRLPGFDGDNSPAAVSRSDYRGRRAILTSSNGTQVLARLKGAGPVFYGSLANASALTARLRQINPDAVTFLAMGRAGEPALEDDLAAQYLAARLAGERPDFAPLRERLLASPAAGRLRGLGREDDLDFCCRLDSHAVVPQVVWGEGLAWAGEGGSAGQGQLSQR
ncbi:MAG: 2-phosphosulfolactate phosphatase [Desulfarculus sp.]|nr:2-phosphosulfolactate phosphatase [Desulfarculus sp.]